MTQSLGLTSTSINDCARRQRSLDILRAIGSGLAEFHGEQESKEIAKVIGLNLISIVSTPAGRSSRRQLDRMGMTPLSDAITVAMGVYPRVNTMLTMLPTLLAGTSRRLTDGHRDKRYTRAENCRIQRQGAAGSQNPRWRKSNRFI